MHDIVLVGCGGSKLPYEAPAQDLYTSTLFRKSRAWAERNGERWFIVSAKHGLLLPTDVVAPYDIQLGKRKGPAIWPWAEDIVTTLVDYHPERVAILAGAVYVEPLRFQLSKHGIATDDPLHGLGIGDRLGWLTREVAA